MTERNNSFFYLISRLSTSSLDRIHGEHKKLFTLPAIILIKTIKNRARLYIWI